MGVPVRAAGTSRASDDGALDSLMAVLTDLRTKAYGSPPVPPGPIGLNTLRQKAVTVL